MTTTVSLRKILDRKTWEMCSPAPVTSTPGVHIASSRLTRQMQYAIVSAGAAYEYLPEEDAWSELPAPGLGGTFAAGAASICTPYSVGYMSTPTQLGAGVQATATGAGSTTTVVTTNNYGVNALVNYQVRCIAGTAANLGQVRAVASNTATTITLAVAFSASTVLGDVFALEPITSVVAGAASTTTVITAISTVNNTAIGTVGNLVASSLITYQIRCTQTALASVANQGIVRYITANTTNSITVGVAFPIAPSTGDVFVIEPYNAATASGVGTTTTVVTTNAWPINQFTGYQLRCLTGTAANLGKVALILSNTATTITTQTALPAATAAADTFVIEPIVFGQELTYAGTATSGGSTTGIPITGTPWLAGQWANSFQVRFTSGTNVGQIRRISNNTASSLTLAQALPVAPDTTSVFIIEPTIQYSQTTSLATNQTLMRDLRGFKIRVMTAGNVADERTILANTTGQNAVITVTVPFSSAPSANPSQTSQTAIANAVGTTTTIVTGNTWVVNALVGYQVRALSGTAGNIGLVRTVVSNTATTLTLSVAFPSATASADTFELDYVQTPVASSVVSTGTGTTKTVVTGNAWSVDAYNGYQLRCVTGTAGNIGKVRVVASNTATTLTLATAFPAPTTSADTFELLGFNGYTTVANGAGTTTTVVTGNTWSVNAYTGYQVRCISGTAGNLGCVRPVVSNTTTTLTVVAFPAATTSGDVFVLEPVQHMMAASSYQLQATRWWVWNAHTVAPVANQFRYYDYAYNVWFSTAGFSAAAVGGVAPVGGWGTDGRLTATPSVLDTASQVFYTDTVTSSSLWTLTCANAQWATNSWSNYQVRIVSGTGAGQVRAIAGNTANTLYVSTWLIAPDATSVFVLEGNDDNLYLYGNASVNLYKFNISSGAWNALAPIVGRAAAPSTGMSGSWAWSTSEPAWADPANIVSGRRIYSFRGSAGGVLDYYDIALNAWVSGVAIAPGAVTFTTGSKHEMIAGRYIYSQKDVTNRLYRTDLVKSETDPVGQFLYPQGAALVSDTMFDVSYVDGGTSITWIYIWLNTSQIMLRMLLI